MSVAPTQSNAAAIAKAVAVIHKETIQKTRINIKGMRAESPHPRIIGVKMDTFIIIGIIVLIAAIAVFYTVKHFKGEGGCCGGGSFKPKRKKLKNVKYTKTFRVDGMHCDHCKGRVEEVVNDIKGVAGRVNLKKGELTVSYAEDVADEIIIAKIERAGYSASVK